MLRIKITDKASEKIMPRPDIHHLMCDGDKRAAGRCLRHRIFFAGRRALYV